MQDELPRIQLHLTLPYKAEIGDHPRVRSHLQSGYGIVQLQRLSDHEVLVTLRPLPPAARSGVGPG
jgi:hypothetical protein